MIKKSVKATTKRGKVTRIPSRAKARTAKKTYEYNTGMANRYSGVEGDLFGTLSKIQSQITNKEAEIFRLKNKIYECDKKYHRNMVLFDKALDRNESKKAEIYLDRNDQLKIDTKAYQKKINVLIEEVRDLKKNQEAYRNVVEKVEPLRWYYAFQSRKASDREGRAKHNAYGYYNDTYAEYGKTKQLRK